VTEAELFQRIVDVAPDFEAVRVEHLRDNFGELLPHLLMADLLRYVALALGAPDKLDGLAVPPSRQEVSAILAVLDRGLAEGDAATDNAIAVSFVEYVWGEPFYPQLEPLLGPELRAEVQRQRDWRPSGGSA
jgi:hypothetical protein